MAVRVVEGKKPYTGGKAIEVTDEKVINLRLREENNLIIYDEGDDEIYVDLQLRDGIRPLDAFPVGVTTGRVLIADDWDVTGTIICAKTTSGDNIKILYGDDGTLWIDNGTGTFKQIYFKADVDLIAQRLQAQIDILYSLGKFLSLWDCVDGEPMSFPLTIPYEYTTGDWFMIGNTSSAEPAVNYRPVGSEWDDTPSSTQETETVEIGDVYIYDGNVWLLQHNKLPTGSGNVIGPDSATDGHLAVFDGATGKIIKDGGPIPEGDTIEYVTQTEYDNLPASKTSDDKHYFIYTSNSPTPPSPGWQPGLNTIAYYPLNGDVLDHNNHIYDATAVGTITYGTIGTKGYMNCDGTVYATATPMIPQTGPFTVSCWEKYDTFYIDSAVFYQRVKYSTGSGINISMYPSGYLQVWRGGGSDWNGVYQINTGVWYNVVLTYSGGESIMYVNGVSVGTSAYTYYGTATDFLIGGWMTTNEDTVTPRNGGPISEIIIEDKVWTAQEISDYFNQTKGDYGIS